MNFDNFETIINTVIVLSFLALLSIFILLIICIVDFMKKRFGRWKIAKISVFIISLLILIYSLPWIFVTFAYMKEYSDKAENLHKLSVKTALLPSVKSVMYAHFGNYYNNLEEGQNAIDAYEKSYEIKNNKDAIVQLCHLYTIKGDRAAAFAACVAAEQNIMVAVNSIMNKNYGVALQLINRKIANDKDVSCDIYALRAYLYKKLNQPNFFEEDLKKAIEKCPEKEGLKLLYREDVSMELENYIEELKSKYKF